MRENQFSTYGRGSALRLSLIISVIVFFIMLITFFFAKARDLNNGVSFFSLFFTISSLCTFLANFVLLYILFLFQFWIIKNPKKSQRKGLLGILGSLALVVIISPVIARLQWEMFNKEVIPMNAYLVAYFLKDIILAVVTILFTSLLYMKELSQRTLLENQKLSMENLQNRYSALKSQVDPHFLFNSLNTLNGLIGFDDEKAHEYVDQLSLVFRYTMQGKQIIHLQEEMDFVKSYIYLMKIRYNDSLQIEINVDEKYIDYYILPFGLQILVENAIKHNVISKKYPLQITIDTTEKDSIKVKNNIQLKPNTVSSGIGLANLNERYQLSFDKEIVINQDENSFTVEIPLIKEIEKFDDKFDKKLYSHESRYCRR